MSKRIAIVAPIDHACAACPWRTSNHGRRHAEGWYTKWNRRRLWNGLRTGNAPGMTCHPTDPDTNPDSPPKAGQETRECAGAWLLIAREMEAFKVAGSVPAYRRGRSLSMTREGLAVAMAALLPPPFGRGLVGMKIIEDDDVSLGLGVGR